MGIRNSAPGIETNSSYIRRNRYTPFETLDVNQLYKDTIEFGQSAAGAILTQIARYSPVLNQSTGLSNQGFIPAFTYRITGSMSLLYQSGDLMNERALCPCIKRNGSLCNLPIITSRTSSGALNIL